MTTVTRARAYRDSPKVTPGAAARQPSAATLTRGNDSCPSTEETPMTDTPATTPEMIPAHVLAEIQADPRGDVYAAYEKGRAAGAAEERQRCAPLLAALHRLYLTVWEETGTVDIGYGGYNGLSYDDTNLIDAAGEAVAKLLATGAVADLLDGGGQDTP